MISLIIDTSTKALGVAITKGGESIAEYSTLNSRNHSEQLMPVIESMLNEVKLKAKEINQVIIARGPGSYTGVRIGVTVAKTLAWTLNIPLYSVSSIEAMASRIEDFQGTIIPLIDARRRTVFTGAYQTLQGSTVNTRPDTHIDFKQWAEDLKKTEENLLFIGHDVHIYLDEIKSTFGDRAAVAPGYLNHPRPSKYVALIQGREPEDVHAFTPEYLRIAEAEQNWINQNNEKVMG